MSLNATFTQLIREHAGILHKVTRLYLDDEADRQDAFQEILLQAWKGFGSFRQDSKFSTWLYRVSLNTVFALNRQAKRQVPVAVGVNLPEVAEVPAGNEQSDRLLQAIRQLPETDRMIVTLHLDDYTNDEIAAITGLTKNNVAVKLHRAKNQLINLLTP